eukprot:1707566-Lingulodinium_polyedra.AAC.1
MESFAQRGVDQDSAVALAQPLRAFALVERSVASALPLPGLLQPGFGFRDERHAQPGKRACEVAE